jgi:ABC-2 type transport system permease protein
MIQPFACVFYGVDVLPPFMQAIALAMPPCHIFEGMRELLNTGEINGQRLLIATGLNLVSLLAAGLLFSKMLGVARNRGLLVKAASS